MPGHTVRRGLRAQGDRLDWVDRLVRSDTRVRPVYQAYLEQLEYLAFQGLQEPLDSQGQLVSLGQPGPTEPRVRLDQAALKDRPVVRVFLDRWEQLASRVHPEWLVYREIMVT